MAKCLALGTEFSQSETPQRTPAQAFGRLIECGADKGPLAILLDQPCQRLVLAGRFALFQLPRTTRIADRICFRFQPKIFTPYET